MNRSKEKETQIVCLVMSHRTIPSKFSCVTVRIGQETLLYMSVSTLVQDGTGCLVGFRKVSKLKLKKEVCDHLTLQNKS